MATIAHEHGGEQQKKTGAELSRAIELVRLAVEYDERGEYLEASAYYALSLPLFERSLLHETIRERRDVIAEKTGEYRTRLGDIETALATLSREEQFPFFYCTYESFLNPGSLYITKTSLVFSPKTRNGARCVVPLESILRYEKIKTKVVVPGIRLDCSGGREVVFNSFASRDDLVRLLDREAILQPRRQSRQGLPTVASSIDFQETMSDAEKHASSSSTSPPSSSSSSSSSSSFSSSSSTASSNTISTPQAPKRKNKPAVGDLDDPSAPSPLRRAFQPDEAGYETLDDLLDGMSVQTVRSALRSSIVGTLFRSASGIISKKPSGEESTDGVAASPSDSTSSGSDSGSDSHSGNSDAERSVQRGGWSHSPDFTNLVALPTPTPESLGDSAYDMAPAAASEVLKYPEEEARLHRLFRLPVGEHLVEHFRCQLEGPDEAGTLFLTKKSLCFCAGPTGQQQGVVGFPSLFRVPLSAVQSIGQEDRFFGPNVLVLSVLGAGLPAAVKLYRFGNFEEASYALRTLHEHLRAQPRIFGQPLKLVLQREGRMEFVALAMADDQPPLCARVPRFLQDAVAYLENPNQTYLETEGLFRVSEEVAALDEASDALDEGSLLYELQRPPLTPHLVAGLLKRFLNGAEPLVPHEFYDLVVASASIPDQTLQIAKLQNLLRVLPREKLMCLHFLCLFLNRVASLGEKNDMPAANLAIVFSPILVRYNGQLSQEEVTDETLSIASIVGLAIEYVQQVFDIYHGDFV